MMSPSGHVSPAEGVWMGNGPLFLLSPFSRTFLSPSPKSTRGKDPRVLKNKDPRLLALAYLPTHHPIKAEDEDGP